ncbi:hypothetical protein B0H14DRAFT_3424602 [Mycena olivaceomarginata]|nr:hypothetical protein B0H14DRAFT_3424602 [Mycena olivaceomarginata]
MEALYCELQLSENVMIFAVATELHGIINAIRDLSTLQALSVYKGAGTYLSQPAPHAMLDALADAQPSPSPSADPALCLLTTALAAALVLHTLCMPLPILWTPMYVKMAANAWTLLHRPWAPECCAAFFSHHLASAASYILHITSGNNEQGFPMKQDVLLWHQPAALRQPLVTLTCVTAPAALVSTSPSPKGEIVGLTDNVLPKRVNKNLTKEDVGEYIVWQVITGKEGARPFTKAPKIQRSVTPIHLQHPHHLKSLIRRRSEHQKEQKAEFDSEVNQALGNIFLSPTMWTDEIFIDALSDALVQRTRPALYDQLDMVTTVTDQRLKAKTTTAICEWAASAISWRRAPVVNGMQSFMPCAASYGRDHFGL